MPFGSQFQVKEHKLVVSQRVDPSQFVHATTEEEHRDNRGIMDDGTSQSLSHKDIHDMKEEGRSGQVGSLCTCNALLFNEQERYKRLDYGRTGQPDHPLLRAPPLYWDHLPMVHTHY